MLMKRASTSGHTPSLRCPTCRRPSTAETIYRVSAMPAGNGSVTAMPVQGSWGTKISAVVGDVLALRAAHAQLVATHAAAMDADGDAAGLGAPAADGAAAGSAALSVSLQPLPPKRSPLPPSPKALILSHWEDMLELVSQALRANGVPFCRLQGRRNLEASLAVFKSDPEVTVLLLPLKLGANGLNLVEAQHVMLLEPVLNTKLEAQAIGRVHRIGQTQPTFVHRRAHAAAAAALPRPRAFSQREWALLLLAASLTPLPS